MSDHPTLLQILSREPQQNAAVLGLLSRLWIREVDLKTLAGLNQPKLRQVWNEVGGPSVADVSDTMVETLAVEYCRLLVGPMGHVSPIQSVWDQNRFQASATESIHKYIEMLSGFQPGLSMVDHVGVQLQYFSALMNMISQSPKPILTGMAEAFFRDHLEWTQSFFQQVAAQAKAIESDFYFDLANLSRNFLFPSS